MLLCRTIGRVHRLGRCGAYKPTYVQEIKHCIDRRVGPLWDSFDPLQGARDMASKPRRSARNKEQALTDIDAGSQVMSVLSTYWFYHICIYTGAGRTIDSTMTHRKADALVDVGCVALHRLPLIDQNGHTCQHNLLFGAQDPSPSTTELDKPPGKEQSRSLRGHRSREDLPADNTLEGTPANKRRRGTRATENGTAPIGHAGDFCDALDSLWPHPEQGSPLP